MSVGIDYAPGIEHETTIPVHENLTPTFIANQFIVRYKIPVSTLIVIYTPQLDVMLLERADHPGYWQSVTGSQNEGETLRETAIREVGEETGLDTNRYALTDWQKRNVFEIYPIWRHRYAPGTTHNTENVFGLWVPEQVPIIVAPREHLRFQWLPYEEAAKKCFSWSNRDAILALPGRAKNEE
jgi:dihydroneopterin triphosphate diphosphatase